MSEGKKSSYLAQRLDAGVEHGQDHVFSFQRTKVKLVDEVEIDLLHTVHPELTKKIETTDDEVIITVTPPAEFVTAEYIKGLPLLTRLTVCLQLVYFAERKRSRRLHPIFSPDNFVFDPSFTPYLLHYGVEESLPPYERAEEDNFNELKATVMELVDPSREFQEYLTVAHALTLSAELKAISGAESFDELRSVLLSQVAEEQERLKQVIPVKKRSWAIRKYLVISLAALLVPLIAYSFYSFFFTQPKQESFLASGEFFMRNQFSNVVSELSDYDPEQMPYSTKYQLARSYVYNESLGDAQEEVVLSSLTLQTDEKYFLYWIHSGRGEHEEALGLARQLEERDLIIYSLVNYRNQVQADDSLTSEERQETVDRLQLEIEEFEREQEEQERLEQEELEQQEQEQQQEEENDQSSMLPFTPERFEVV